MTPGAFAALAWLAARRTLGGPLALFCLALIGALALFGGGEAAAELLGPDGASERDTAGLARARVWGAGLWILIPLAFAQWARALDRRGAGEDLALAAEPVSPRWIALACFAGWLWAGALPLLALAAAGEFAAGHPARDRVHPVPQVPALVLGAPGEWGRVLLPTPPEGPDSRLAVELWALPGRGGGADVALAIVPADGGDTPRLGREPSLDAQENYAVARVRGRARVELPLGDPARWRGPLALELVRLEGGPAVGLGERALSWVEGGAPRAFAPWALVAHGAGLLAAGGALLAVFRRWLGSGLALPLLAALALAALGSPGLADLPGPGLARALAGVEAGFAPVAPPLWQLAAWVLGAALVGALLGGRPTGGRRSG